MSQFFIVVGDKTDHGGTVLEGSPADTIDGKPIARVGDKVHCPRSTCRGSQIIVEGDPGVLIDGKPAAFHGAKTSCGAVLIASKIDNQLGGAGDSSYSAIAFSEEEEPVDPRTGLRAGPTRENLRALGMPQSHSASGLSANDPLPGSIMSGDYAAQNDVTLSKEQRRERVFMLLKSRESQLRSAGEHYGIDPRAIAAAISWEFTENSWGYTSDKVLAPTQQDGYGWGSIHDETLRKEMLPGTSLNESVALRNNLDSSIDLVGGAHQTASKHL